VAGKFHAALEFSSGTVGKAAQMRVRNPVGSTVNVLIDGYFVTADSVVDPTAGGIVVQAYFAAIGTTFDTTGGGSMHGINNIKGLPASVAFFEAGEDNFLGSTNYWSYVVGLANGVASHEQFFEGRGIVVPPGFCFVVEHTGASHCYSAMHWTEY